MELSQVGFNHRGQNFRCTGDITDPDWTMLFRRTMVLEVLRTFQQDENRYTCCRRTVLSGEKGTKIGYRQGGGKGEGGRGWSKLGTAGPLFAVFPTFDILFAALIHATISDTG